MGVVGDRGPSYGRPSGRSIARPAPEAWREGLSFALARRLFRRLLLPLLLDLHVEGLEQVPSRGPYILASNHLSMLDPVVLLALLPRRPSFLARAELFRSARVGLLVRWAGAIPVERVGMDVGALRRARRLLEAGVPIGVFPEGGRIKQGGLAPGMPGVGLLALRTGAPVAPVALLGTERFLRGKRPRWRPRVVARFGPPIHPEELRACPGAREATDLIMRRIADLLPPGARGAYRPAVGAAHGPSSRAEPPG
jgi:1-acyl-sn-glycerol-3-phosphate acyltransferase